MSDIAKVLAKNQNEMLKWIAPLSKKQPAHLNNQDSDSESENISVVKTSTPVKSNATQSKTTPMNSRNMVTGVLNDSTNQPTMRPKQQRVSSEQVRDRPSTSEVLFAPQPQTFQSTNLFPMPKALTASLPDHVENIHNRAYQEDKPYNDIVLHLEREMRLNGLGAPDA